MQPVKQKKSRKKQTAEPGSTRIERGIYRVNYPSHKGIRVFLKFKDTVFQKVFALGSKGGERKALATARKWRRERLREIQNSPAAQNPLKKKMKNNTSGITGVRRGKTAWSAVWSATYTENGKQFHRSFSIEKYGEEQAFKLACEARADFEKRLYGKVYQPELIHALGEKTAAVNA